jgi:hypothetical protein
MTEPLTISFVGTTDIKQWLEQSAKKDDRSVSYVLRQILEREMHRSRAQPTQEPIWQSSQ